MRATVVFSHHIAIDHLDELFELICAKRSRVGSAAFVGRRGVEWRATVRISMVGVTGARCGFVIDLWVFRRANSRDAQERRAKRATQQEA